MVKTKVRLTLLCQSTSHLLEILVKTVLNWIRHFNLASAEVRSQTPDSDSAEGYSAIENFLDSACLKEMARDIQR